MNAEKYLQDIETDYRKDCLSRGLELDDLIAMIKNTGLVGLMVKKIEQVPPSEENDFHCEDYLALLSGAATTGSFNTMGVALALYHLGANARGILNASSALIVAIELKHQLGIAKEN